MINHSQLNISLSGSVIHLMILLCFVQSREYLGRSKNYQNMYNYDRMLLLIMKYFIINIGKMVSIPINITRGSRINSTQMITHILLWKHLHILPEFSRPNSLISYPWRCCWNHSSKPLKNANAYITFALVPTRPAFLHEQAHTVVMVWICSWNNVPIVLGSLFQHFRMIMILNLGILLRPAFCAVHMRIVHKLIHKMDPLASINRSKLMQMGSIKKILPHSYWDNGRENWYWWEILDYGLQGEATVSLIHDHLMIPFSPNILRECCP